MFRCVLDPDTELRLLEPRHADELYALIDRNREHLRRWMSWVDDCRSAEDVRQSRRKSLHDFAENGCFDAGIWYRGDLAGVLGVHRITRRDRVASLGYWLGEEYHGKGLMTRAGRAVIAHLFGELGLNRVEIRCAAGNRRSAAVAERLGFRHEATLRQACWERDHFEDDEVYGLLKDEVTTA